MFFQNPVSAAPIQVGTPKDPESLANPKPFYIEFGRNKIKKDGSNMFIRNEYKELNWTNLNSACQQYIAQHHDWGLYATAYHYSTPDPYTADLRGDFYLDFDDEDNIARAQEDALRIIQHLTISPKYRIPSNMIRVYFSGKKGIHVIIPYQVFGIEWHPHLDKIYKIMAEELLPFAPNQTLDLKVYERRRMFRLKGSRHPSTGSYKVPMELKYLLAYKEHDIQNLSKDPAYGSWIRYDKPRVILEAARQFKECEYKFTQRFNKRFSNTEQNKFIDFDPPCYAEIIDNGPVKGSRNHLASILVVYWRRRGHSEQDTWDMLVDWNNGSLPERELQTLFRSNFHGHYVYGCNTIKTYASCPATCKEDCKFYKSN